MTAPRSTGRASHPRRTAPSKSSLQIRNTQSHVGRDSSVGIATRYRPDGPGIESQWGRDFPHPSRPALGPIQPPVQWVPGLSPGVKRPGRGADHPPHLSPRIRKSRATPLLPFWAFVACSRVTFTFTFTQSHCVNKACGAHNYHCALNGYGNTCLKVVASAYSTSPTQAALCQGTGVIFSVASSKRIAWMTK